MKIKYAKMEVIMNIEYELRIMKSNLNMMQKNILKCERLLNQIKKLYRENKKLEQKRIDDMCEDLYQEELNAKRKNI